MNHFTFSVNSKINVYLSGFALEEARHNQGPGLGEVAEEPPTVGCIQRAEYINLECF